VLTADLSAFVRGFNDIPLNLVKFIILTRENIWVSYNICKSFHERCNMRYIIN